MVLMGKLTLHIVCKPDTLKSLEIGVYITGIKQQANPVD